MDGMGSTDRVTAAAGMPDHSLMVTGGINGGLVVKFHRRWRRYYFRGATQRTLPRLFGVPVSIARLEVAFAPATSEVITRVLASPATTAFFKVRCQE